MCTQPFVLFCIWWYRQCVVDSAYKITEKKLWIKQQLRLRVSIHKWINKLEFKCIPNTQNETQNARFVQHSYCIKKTYISYAPIFHCVRCNIALGKWLSRWMYLCIVYLSSTTNHVLNERVGFYLVSKWVNMCVVHNILGNKKDMGAKIRVCLHRCTSRFACSIFSSHWNHFQIHTYLCISHTNKHIYICTWTWPIYITP